MHRIDAEGNVNERFSDGQPEIGVQGTTLNADWLNDVQENICYLIESAGYTLEKGNYAQLTNAILEVVGGSGTLEKLTRRIQELNAAFNFGAKHVFRQPNEPDADTQGPFFDNDIWIDTNDNGRQYLWNSLTGTWADTTNEATGRGALAASSLEAIADGEVTIYVQDTTPNTPSVGDIWYNQRDDILWVRDATSWLRVTDKFTKDTIVSAVINKAAQDATALADSKIQSWYSASAPANLAPENNGDLWFDTDDNFKLYRFQYPSWVPVHDPRIAKAFDYIFLQGSILDGTVFVYFSTVAPTHANQSVLDPPNPDPSQGDLWLDITPVSGSPRNQPYLFTNNQWVIQNDPDLKKMLVSAAEQRAIQDGQVTIYVGTTEPDDTFIPAPRYGDIWFDSTLITIDDPDAADPRTDPQIQVPKMDQYRYDGTDWIPIEQYKLKLVAANIKTEQLVRAEETSALSASFTEATTSIGENTASISEALASIDGIVAGYGVRANVDGKVTGFGFLTDWDIKVTFTYDVDSLRFRPGDEVFQGASWAAKTWSAVVVSVDERLGHLRMVSETGSYTNGGHISVRDRLDVDATATARTLNPTPGESEFEIVVDRFKVTDGSTSATPLRLEGGVLFIGSVDTTRPQVTYIGEFASEPATTYTINSTYKNTTDNTVYILQYVSGDSGPKEWVPFLERGENGQFLILTKDAAGYLFDSNAAEDPRNPNIHFTMRYAGLSFEPDESIFEFRNAADSVLTVTLPDFTATDNEVPDNGGTTHRGTATFTLPYDQFAESDFPVTITVTAGDVTEVETLYRVVGSTAKSLQLTPDSYVFIFEDELATDPNNTSIGFTIRHVNLDTAVNAGNITIVDDAANTYSPSSFVGASGVTGTATFVINWADVNTATFPLTITVEDEDLTDVVTIREIFGGADALVGFLTNQSHTVPAGETGTIEAGGLDGAIGTFEVFKGIVRQNSGVTYSVFSATGATATIDDTSGSTAGNYSITSMSANKATVIFQAVLDGVTLKQTMSLTKSVAGVAARAINLTSTSNIFAFAMDGNPVTVGDTITFTVSKTSNLGTVTWAAVNDASGSVTLSGSGSTRTLSLAQFGSANWVRVTVSASDGSTTYSDTITVNRVRHGSDAIVISMSNENHGFTADETDTIESGTITDGNCTFTVYRGGSLISYNASVTNNTWRLGSVTASSGLTAATGLANGTVGLSAMNAVVGYLDVPVNYTDNNGVTTTYTRRVSYTKSSAGVNARALVLTSTDVVFKFNGDNLPINSGDSITFSPFGFNLSAPFTWTAVDQDNVDVSGLLTNGTGNDKVLSITNFGTKTSVKVTVSKTVTIDGTPTTFSDVVTVNRLSGASDGLVLVLSNERHTFSVNSVGQIPNLGAADCTVSLYRGLNTVSFQETAANEKWRFGTITATGVTYTRSGQTFSITGITEDSAFIDVIVTYRNAAGNDISLTRRMSYARVNDGLDAVGGISVIHTNKNHTFATDKDGNLLSGVTFADANDTISVYIGDTPATYSSVPKASTFRLGSISPSGVTINSGLTEPTVGISAMTGNTGYLDVPVIVVPPDTAIANAGFELGTLGATTTISGWTFFNNSGPTNATGFASIVDTSSLFRSTMSYGAYNGDPFAGTPPAYWQIGKRFGVAANPTTLRVTAKCFPRTMTPPGSIPTTGNTYLAATDCYGFITCYDGNGNAITQSTSSHKNSTTLSHQMALASVAGAIGGTWRTFDYTFTLAAGTAYVVFNMRACATNTPGVQALGFTPTTGSAEVLFDDFVFEANGTLYDTTTERTLNQRLTYSKSKTGADAQLYYIKPTSGTSILNGAGTLTGELRFLSGGTDNAVSASGLTSSSIQLYKDGVAFSPRATSYNLSTSDITGTCLIEARIGDGGTLLDSVTLFDVYDGLSGGSIDSNNGLTLTRLNSESATYSPSDSTLTGRFYAAGSSTPITKSVIISAQAINAPSYTPQMKWSLVAGGSSAIAVTVVRETGASVTADTWTSGIVSLTARFTYTDPATGRVTNLEETVYRSEAGTRGSRQFYGTATTNAWSDSEANAVITTAGAVKQLNDVVTLSKTTVPTFAQTRYWNGSAWTLVSQVIDGNLVVQGTLSADRIATGSLTSAVITVGSAGKMILSGATENLEVKDASNVTRVRIGKNGANYGLWLYDSAGATILSSGQALTTTDISGLGAFATISQITSANVSTYIGSAAIGTTQIGNAAITTAKIADATITSAKIGDAQITDAKIVSLSADKLTAATIGVALNLGASAKILLDGTNNRIVISD